MSDKAKIAAIYTGVAIICAGIIAMVAFTRGGMRANHELVANVGKDTSAPVITQLTEGQKVITQDGKEMDILDLKGKVWVFVQFFAACPQCAQRNLTELKRLVDRYKNEPDFRLVCITVDPERDNIERLKGYADVLGADSSRWLFLTGESETLMPYMVSQIKYPKVKRRTDPAQIAQFGEFAHDLMLAVFDRDLQMRGKYELFGLEEKKPGQYKENVNAMNKKIRTFLEQ